MKLCLMDKLIRGSSQRGQGASNASANFHGGSHRDDIKEFFDDFFLSSFSDTFDPLEERMRYETTSFFVTQALAFESSRRLACPTSLCIDAQFLTMLAVSKQLVARAKASEHADGGNTCTSLSAVFRMDCEGSGGTFCVWAVPKIYGFARYPPAIDAFRSRLDSERSRNGSLKEELRSLKLERDALARRVEELERAALPVSTEAKALDLSLSSFKALI